MVLHTIIQENLNLVVRSGLLFRKGSSEYEIKQRTWSGYNHRSGAKTSSEKAI